MTAPPQLITQPDSTDVVIVGGGIVGVSAAYFLAKQGIPVVLCEKGRIAGEQSGRNWGFIRQQGRHPAEIPLMIKSLEIWHQIAQEITQEAAKEIDRDIGFHVGGTLYLSTTDAQYQAHHAWLEHAKTFQLDSKFLSAAELKTLLPQLKKQPRGALYTPSDARAEPRRAVCAIARLATKHGAILLENCAVRGVDIAAGKVAGVVTEHGRIKASAVLLAGGAWSSYFCRHLHIRLPQLQVTSSVMATEPTDLSFQQSLWSNGLGMRKRQDGGYNVAYAGHSDCQITPDFLRYFTRFLAIYRHSKEEVNLKIGKRFFEELAWSSQCDFEQITPYEKERVLNPPANEQFLAQSYRLLQENFPQLKGIGIAKKWAGMIDVTPDELPVIDRIDSVPGLVISTGYSGHGFGIGPGAGYVSAQLISGSKPQPAVTEFSFSRLRKP